VLTRIEKELAAEERVGTRLGTLVPQRKTTYALVALNLAVFLGAFIFGETTEGNAWFAFGVLDTWGVRAGQWWRVVTSTFFHANVIHLCMNVLALLLLGPFIERNLRWLRFLALYLVTGACSMTFVYVLHRNDDGPYFALGASGAIMGLVGASGAIFLNAWLHERVRSVFVGLRRVVLAVALQAVFDLATPRVSLAAHCSGLVAGFVAMFVLLRLNDRKSER
jgi:rhomboid protease GluP